MVELRGRRRVYLAIGIPVLAVSVLAMFLWSLLVMNPIPSVYYLVATGFAIIGAAFIIIAIYLHIQVSDN